MQFTASDFVTTPGKRTCKYYTCCGSLENCKRCNGYSKAKEADKYERHNNKKIRI